MTDHRADRRWCDEPAARWWPCQRARSVGGAAAALCLIPGLSLLAITPGGVRAQLLRGKVLDAGSGEPVAAAEVWVRTPAGAEVARALSRGDGWFSTSLESVAPPAILVLRVSRIGYDSTATTSVRLSKNEDLEVEIRVRPKAVNLPGIEVVAQPLTRYLAANGFYQRKKMGHGGFLDESQIDAKHPVFSHDLLKGTSGIRLVPTKWGDYEPLITRGGGLARICLPTVWIDGMRVRGSGNDLTPFIELDRLVRPEDIGGFEVYRGPAEMPPQYRKDRACGVFVIWTRH